MSISRRHLIGSLAAAPVVLAIVRTGFAGDARIALQGYDPVAYFTLGKPTKGKEEFFVEYDETRYLFASAEHRALFVANPDKYAPMYNGYCSMGMTKGDKIEPDPQNWVIVDGHLYVASSPITPGMMATNGDNVRQGVAEWSKNHPATK